MCESGLLTELVQVFSFTIEQRYNVIPSLLISCHLTLPSVTRLWLYQWSNLTSKEWNLLLYSEALPVLFFSLVCSLSSSSDCWLLLITWVSSSKCPLPRGLAFLLSVKSENAPTLPLHSQPLSHNSGSFLSRFYHHQKLSRFIMYLSIVYFIPLKYKMQKSVSISAYLFVGDAFHNFHSNLKYVFLI